MSTAYMRIYASDWDKSPSFKLIPVSSFCPYNEVIYDPNSKTLVLISKEHKQGFQMVKKLDANGLPEPVQGRGNTGFKEQRVQYDAYYEYYLTNPQDIQEMVELLSQNSDHAAFRAFFPPQHSSHIPSENLGYQSNGASVNPAYETDIEPNTHPRPKEIDPDVLTALDPENAPTEPVRGVTDNPDADVPQEELMLNIERNKEIFYQQEELATSLATFQNEELVHTNEH